MGKSCSTQSHLRPELPFSCVISGLILAELSHSKMRRIIVGFNCAHKQRGSSSKSTASHHSLPATCVSTDGNVWTSGAQMLCGQSELFSSFFFLNCHPLKSRVSASSPAPTHGPIAEAIKLSTSLSSSLLLPPPPLNSFSLPPPLSSSVLLSALQLVGRQPTLLGRDLRC